MNIIPILFINCRYLQTVIPAKAGSQCIIFILCKNLSAIFNSNWYNDPFPRVLLTLAATDIEKVNEETK